VGQVLAGLHVGRVLEDVIPLVVGQLARRRFFFADPELSMALWNIIAGISGLGD